jgi:hypothetical protein
VQALAGTPASGEGLNSSVCYFIDNTYFAMQIVLPLSYLGEGAGGEVFTDKLSDPLICMIRMIKDNEKKKNTSVRSLNKD